VERVNTDSPCVCFADGLPGQQGPDGKKGVHGVRGPIGKVVSACGVSFHKFLIFTILHDKNAVPRLFASAHLGAHIHGA
jgi:hypothetical protein